MCLKIYEYLLFLKRSDFFKSPSILSIFFFSENIIFLITLQNLPSSAATRNVQSYYQRHHTPYVLERCTGSSTRGSGTKSYHIFEAKFGIFDTSWLKSHGLWKTDFYICNMLLVPNILIKIRLWVYRRSYGIVELWIKPKTFQLICLLKQWIKCCSVCGALVNWFDQWLNRAFPFWNFK